MATTTSGLTRRRGGAADGDNGIGSRTNSAANVRDSPSGGGGGPETSYEESGENGHRIAFDPRDISESAERSKQPKLTLMEEVLLLGLKDKQVGSPFSFCSSFFARLVWDDRLTWAQRATFHSGTTTSRTRCAGASSSNSPSAAA
jgi:hypothetical protein